MQRCLKNASKPASWRSRLGNIRRKPLARKLLAASNAADQIPDNRDVQRQNTNSREGEAVSKFVEFQRDENSGRDYREVFSPMAPHQQADAFGKKQPGVEEGADAELLELFGADRENPGQNLVDEMIFGIDAE